MKRFLLAVCLFSSAGLASGCEGCNKPKEAPLAPTTDASIPSYVSSSAAKPHINPQFHPQRVPGNTPQPAPSGSGSAPAP